MTWLDLLAAVIVLTLVLKALKSSLLNEFFKLLGAFFATFIGLHYFHKFGLIFEKHLGWMEQPYADLLGFSLLVLLFLVFFVMIQEGWKILLEIDDTKKIYKPLCILVSLMTSYLLCGLLMIAIMISNNRVLLQTGEASFSAKVAARGSIDLYNLCHGIFIKPFFPNEKFNEAVEELKMEYRLQEEDIQRQLETSPRQDR